MYIFTSRVVNRVPMSLRTLNFCRQVVSLTFYLYDTWETLPNAPIKAEEAQTAST